MKQFLSSMLCDVKQFLAATFIKLEEILVPLLRQIKQKLVSYLRNLKKTLTPKYFYLLVLFVILLVVLMLGLAMCSGGKAPAYEEFTGYVTVDTLDVHKQPKASSRILGQLTLDSEVTILDQQTDGDINWGLIEDVMLDNGKVIKEGWIDLQCIISADSILNDPEPTPEETEPVPEVIPVEATMGTITAHKLNIRKGPNSSYETNGAYYKGDRVEILETEIADGTEWGRTNLGWVGMGYVRMDGSDGQSENIPANANFITNGDHTILGYGIVDLKKLNVRLGPGTEYGKVTTVSQSTRYAYYEVYESSVNWVRIEDGWVSTEHFYLEGTVSSNAMTGSVTTDNLNIRTGPDTSFRSVGSYAKDTTIEILAQVDGWGYTEQGWVFMAYVEYVTPTYPTGSGTVNNGLNIRKEPSSDSEIVGTYTTGDRVTIIEVDGAWGKTDIGWINLKYITYD